MFWQYMEFCEWYGNHFLFQNKQEDIYGNLAAYYTPASDENGIYSQLKTCGIMNILHNHIK